MPNDEGSLNVSFMGGLGIGLAIAIFLLLISPPFVSETWCVAGEPPLACFREWASVPIGILTVVGGFAAAYFVYRTIVKMNEQLLESKRQTAFVVGDEEPSLELRQNSVLQGGNFEIVNWNRRPFYVMSARWKCSVGVSTNQQLEIESPGKITVDLDNNGIVQRRLDVPGWKDRSGPPNELRGMYFVTAQDDLDAEPQRGVVIPITLEIMGYLSGEQRKPIRLTATRPLRLVVALEQMYPSMPSALHQVPPTEAAGLTIPNSDRS
jgi:hypothetical protein